MEDRLEFEIKVDEKALLRFQFYSVYHNLQGVVGLLLSILCLVYAVLGFGKTNAAAEVLLVFLGLFYIVFKPLGLVLKNKLIIRQGSFDRPISFSCGEDGIIIRQGEEEAELKWENIWRVVVRKKDLYVYTGRIYAYTLPKDQLEDKWTAFTRLAESMKCRIV